MEDRSQFPREGIDWSWESEAISPEFYDPLTAALLRHTPPAARVLEIGVGGGYVLSRLNRLNGSRCIGVDVLASALEASRQTARRLGAELGLLQGSGFMLPFRDESFDVVISLGVIEHFERQSSLAMLREHARVCRRGGRCLVSTPNALDLLHLARRARLGRRYRYYPERSYTPWGLARELRASGLSPVAIDGYAPLWSLRQSRWAYPLTALLHKLGLLRRLGQLENPSVLAWLGSYALVVAQKSSSPRDGAPL